ncbi:MAG: phosphoribosyltransferase [Bacteroidota bacterium]|jgi:predicted phosphoribosyltransferase|uniref:phosphoribosyltransferase n=1 Tax=Candidatus Pollutiaquabacter sp. TaxID=3416354 RepID=UPI001A51FF32|nr:phosphoribosyltransferase [Bacteroidota bacterium]MBL7948062.1 phosphoribosyltransferase [Bacteroidia bacterium]MBP6009860.1 phosphoribosyltransferase [Bacteroidia bacterium]MBP7271099.1 phosphoribosyltransferase [Bacteroidia bacterium]MBP7436425.1 phosphoribosyltransferase [Bacteroidia bacterium]
MVADRVYLDRAEAAMQLLPLLHQYRGLDGVVVAIPRGGVPMGAIIARELGWPLDIALVKKIGHPENPEFAIGAVSSDDLFIDPEFRSIPGHYLEQRILEIRKSIQEKRLRYLGSVPPLPLLGRKVIVVDDGIATGHTLRMTLRLLRKQKPGELIVAVPVSSTRAAGMLEKECDTFLCLQRPDDFYGVGQYYANFQPVSDAEVVQLLRRYRK